MSRTPKRLAIMVLAVSMGAVGCQNNTVRVKFQHHISAGQTVDAANNVVPAPADSYWALFHIVCISNDDDEPQTFVFDPLKLKTNDPSETVINAANQAAGMTQSVTLQAGESKPFVGSVILRMTGTWGGNQPRYLLYDTSENDSVLPYRDNFANLGGPTLDLDNLPSPAYPPGADPCEDGPIQSPH